MQSPAEKHLVKTITLFLDDETHNKRTRILNIGAGKSLSIENQLVGRVSFVCDRVDIENCQVERPFIGQCYQCSVEAMHPIKPGEYYLAFSNYVLEHIQHLDKAAGEIYRVLRPRGVFVASIPNPTAPEVLLAKRTSTWFHRVIREGRAWETFYAFKDIRMLSSIFEEAGFKTVEVSYWSCISLYLKRFIALNKLGYFYDTILNKLQFKRFMSNVCIVFERP